MLTYEIWTKLSITKCSSDELEKCYYGLVIVNSYIAFGVIICEFLVSLCLAIYQHATAVIREHRKFGVQLFVTAGIMNGAVVSSIFVCYYELLHTVTGQFQKDFIYQSRKYSTAVLSKFVYNCSSLANFEDSFAKENLLSSTVFSKVSSLISDSKCFSYLFHFRCICFILKKIYPENGYKLPS